MATTSGRGGSVLTNVVTIITAVMVSALFLIWAVFGTQTVNNQNATILKGVQTQLSKVEDDVAATVRQNSVGDRAIVCILRLAPPGTAGVAANEQRSDKNVNSCLTAAEAGFDNLPDWYKAGKPNPEK